MIFTAATVGLLVSSLAAERLAKRRAQRTLIMAGFVVTIGGIGVLLALVERLARAPGRSRPGCCSIGLGVGVMLTPSVNVVQSSFPEEQQGEISGLSRSVSNLGSSLGTAIAGTILVAGLVDWSYGARDGRAGCRRARRAGRRVDAPAQPGRAATPAPQRDRRFTRDWMMTIARRNQQWWVVEPLGAPGYPTWPRRKGAHV